MKYVCSKSTVFFKLFSVPVCDPVCLNGATCLANECLCPEGLTGTQCDIIGKLNY